MAYGDLPLDAPEKPNKGLEGGACNRQSCQTEPALWYNHGSDAWYCADCRHDIQFDDFNHRDWVLNWQPRKGHPMFETRAQMDIRASRCAVQTEVHPIDQAINDVVGPYFGWPSGREKPQSSRLERLLKHARRRA